MWKTKRYRQMKKSFKRLIFISIVFFSCNGCHFYFNFSQSIPQENNPNPIQYTPHIPQPSNTIIIEAETPTPIELKKATETELLDEIDKKLTPKIIKE